jgi:hypothetical protein
LPNNIILFVIIDKFDPNPILVNINKLKPYMFIEDKTLQLVLAKPSDLVSDESIQTKEPALLLVESKYLQHVEFEPVNNPLTNGNIIGIDVPICYYHDVHVEDNNVIIRNDQNDAFSGTLIGVYNLKVYNPEVYNPKGHVYS